MISRNLSGLPSSLRFSRHMPRSLVDPDRPSENSPNRALCVGFWAVGCPSQHNHRFLLRNALHCYANFGAVSSIRKCGLPCGLCRSLCTLQLFRSVSTPPTQLQTLGMGGWLDPSLRSGQALTQQGLSPCKKRQAFLGAPTVWLSGRADGQGALAFLYRFWQAATRTTRAKPCPLEALLGRA